MTDPVVTGLPLNSTWPLNGYLTGEPWQFPHKQPCTATDAAADEHNHQDSNDIEARGRGGWLWSKLFGHVQPL
jgi:hypothetical protein